MVNLKSLSMNTQMDIQNTQTHSLPGQASSHVTALCFSTINDISYELDDKIEALIYFHIDCVQT